MTIENKEFNIFSSFLMFLFFFIAFLKLFQTSSLVDMLNPAGSVVNQKEKYWANHSWRCWASGESMVDSFVSGGLWDKNHNDKHRKKFKLQTEARNWFNTIEHFDQIIKYSCISLDFCQSERHELLWGPMLIFFSLALNRKTKSDPPELKGQWWLQFRLLYTRWR